MVFDALHGGDKAKHHVKSPIVDSVTNTEVCCGLCGKLNAKFKCSKCKQINYCNRECQLAHWANVHKAECKIFRRTSFLSEKYLNSNDTSAQKLNAQLTNQISKLDLQTAMKEVQRAKEEVEKLRLDQEKALEDLKKIHLEKEKIPAKEKADGILKFASSSKVQEVQEAEINIKDAPNYGSSDYWEERFKTHETKPYEWYLPFEELQSYFEDFFPDKSSHLLELGCGNSELAENLIEICGYKNLSAVDLSDSAIRQCEQRLQEKKEKQQKGDDIWINYQVADVRNMAPLFANNSVGGIFEKGTLDAIMSSSEDGSGVDDIKDVYLEAMRILDNESSKNPPIFVAISNMPKTILLNALHPLLLPEYLKTITIKTQDYDGNVFIHAMQKPNEEVHLDRLESFRILRQARQSKDDIKRTMEEYKIEVEKVSKALKDAECAKEKQGKLVDEAWKDMCISTFEALEEDEDSKEKEKALETNRSKAGNDGSKKDSSLGVLDANEQKLVKSSQKFLCSSNPRKIPFLLEINKNIDLIHVIIKYNDIETRLPSHFIDSLVNNQGTKPNPYTNKCQGPMTFSSWNLHVKNVNHSVYGIKLFLENKEIQEVEGNVKSIIELGDLPLHVLDPQCKHGNIAWKGGEDHGGIIRWEFMEDHIFLAFSLSSTLLGMNAINGGELREKVAPDVIIQSKQSLIEDFRVDDLIGEEAPFICKQIKQRIRVGQSNDQKENNSKLKPQYFSICCRFCTHPLSYEERLEFCLPSPRDNLDDVTDYFTCYGESILPLKSSDLSSIENTIMIGTTTILASKTDFEGITPGQAPLSNRTVCCSRCQTPVGEIMEDSGGPSSTEDHNKKDFYEKESKCNDMNLYFHRICTRLSSSSFPGGKVDLIDNKRSTYICPISQVSSIETYTSRKILNHILKDGCFRFIFYNEEDCYLLQKRNHQYDDNDTPSSTESFNPQIEVIHVVALRWEGGLLLPDFEGNMTKKEETENRTVDRDENRYSPFKNLFPAVRLKYQVKKIPISELIPRQDSKENSLTEKDRQHCHDCPDTHDCDKVSTNMPQRHTPVSLNLDEWHSMQFNLEINADYFPKEANTQSKNGEGNQRLSFLRLTLPYED